MDYNEMSVHDLLCEALALQERAKLMGDREPFTDAMLAEIESALRKAVVRDASVGVAKLSHNGVASDYDIVPRGNP